MVSTPEEIQPQANRLYRILFNSVSDGFVIRSMTGEVVDANPAVTEIFGYTYEEYIKLPLKTLVHSSVASSIQLFLDQLRNTGKSFIPDAIGVRKNGQPIYLEISGQLIDYNGTPHIFTTIRDVTRQKLAEEEREKFIKKYQSLFQNSSDALLLIKDGIVIECNSKSQEMFCCTFHDTGISLLALSPELQPDGRPSSQVMEGILNNVLSGDHARFEWKYQKMDGTLFDAEVSLNSIVIADENFVQAIVRDISERKLVEFELHNYKNHLEKIINKRTKELNQANEELNTFNYSVSHDLKAPIRRIRSFLQLITEDHLSTISHDVKNHLERIEYNVIQMAELIEGLLQFSRAAHENLNRESIELHTIVSAIASDLLKSEPERNVEFIINNTSPTQCDPNLMKTVIQNLVGNAWKYTSKVKSAIIEFGECDFNNERVFYLKDNGVGFDMQYANKIYYAFQRLHNDADFEGSGIGLATVKRILKRHGGKIFAESAPNQGTTFYFTCGDGD